MIRSEEYPISEGEGLPGQPLPEYARWLQKFAGSPMITEDGRPVDREAAWANSKEHAELIARGEAILDAWAVKAEHGQRSQTILNPDVKPSPVPAGMDPEEFYTSPKGHEEDKSIFTWLPYEY